MDLRAMKPVPLIFAVVSACCLLLAGCTGPQVPAPVSASTQTTVDWQAGEYAVSFRAGPVVDSGRKSFSFYEVKRALDDNRVPEAIVAESALSLDSFRSGYLKEAKDHIRLFTSSSGKTLLIEEEIPNDCAPCSNWIMVRGVNGELVFDYLDLPTHSKNADDIYADMPSITRVSEKEIGLRYPDGTRRTVAVKDVVKKEKRPTFPG